MKALVISSPMFAEIRGQTAASLLEGKKKHLRMLHVQRHVSVCAIHQGSLTLGNKQCWHYCMLRMSDMYTHWV